MSDDSILADGKEWENEYKAEKGAREREEDTRRGNSGDEAGRILKWRKEDR